MNPADFNTLIKAGLVTDRDKTEAALVEAFQAAVAAANSLVATALGGADSRAYAGDGQRAERKALRDSYKAECKAAGVKVTDKMIGLEVKPDSKDARIIVQKLLACHPKYESYDSRIRRVFAEKPHLSRKR